MKILVVAQHQHDGSPTAIFIHDQMKEYVHAGHEVLVIAPVLTKKFGLERLIRMGLLAGTVVHLMLFGMHMLFDVNIWVHMAMNVLGSGAIGIGSMMQWGLVS